LHTFSIVYACFFSLNLLILISFVCCSFLQRALKVMNVNSLASFFFACLTFVIWISYVSCVTYVTHYNQYYKIWVNSIIIRVTYFIWPCIHNCLVFDTWHISRPNDKPPEKHIVSTKHWKIGKYVHLFILMICTGLLFFTSL
jgi:hypothetical protein